MGLTNREWAWVFWLCAVIVTVLAIPGIRRAAKKVLAILFGPGPIRLLLLSLMLWTVVSVWLLRGLDIWTPGQIKATVLWVLGTALVNVFKIADASDEREHQRALLETISDAFKVTVIVEFVLHAEAFGFLIEVVLLPVMIVLLMAVEFSKNKRVKSLCEMVVALFVLFMLGLSIFSIWRDPVAFFNLFNAREFVVPIGLSILLIPFLYVFDLYLAYETAFQKLRFAHKDADSLRFRKWDAAVRFFLDGDGLIEYAQSQVVRNPTDRAALRQRANEIKAVLRFERVPQDVSPLLGWSPQHVREIFRRQAIKMSRYRRGYDAWRATSQELKLGEGVLPNRVWSGIEGDHLVVKRVWMKLYVNEPADEQSAIEKFSRVVSEITDELMAGVPIDALGLSIPVNGGEVVYGYLGFSLTREDWPHHPRGGYDLEFEIRHRMP